jgi:hypothetical protein
MPAFGRRVSLLAGAGFGLATPLFFYGTTVWEHSLTVAGVLLAAVLLQRPGPGAALLAGMAVGFACWLREELALMGLAFVVVEHLRTRDLRRTLALVAGGGACGAALAAFNLSVYASVLGPHAAALDPALALAGPGVAELATRLASLVVGWANGPAGAFTLSSLAVAALGLVAVLEWRKPGRALGFALAATIGVGGFGLMLVQILEGPPLVALVRWNGLVPQLPLVGLAGIGLLRVWKRESCAPLRPGIAAGLAFLAVAIGVGLVTQSVFGMGLHFAPRKLLPALPALAGLAVVAVCTTPVSVPARIAGSLLAAAGVAASVLAGTLLLYQKAEGAALQDAIRARPERYAVSGDALLTQALTGIWHDTPLLYTPRRGSLLPIVTAMREQGVERFLAIASQATPLDAAELGLECRALPPHRGGVIGYWDTDLLTCGLRP